MPHNVVRKHELYDHPEEHAYWAHVGKQPCYCPHDASRLWPQARMVLRTEDLNTLDYSVHDRLCRRCEHSSPKSHPARSNEPIPWGVGNLVNLSKAVFTPWWQRFLFGICPCCLLTLFLLPTSTPSMIVTNIVTSSDSPSAISTSKPAGSGALPLGFDSRVGLSAATLIFAAVMWVVRISL